MTKPFFVAFSDLCSFSIFMINLFLFHRCGKGNFSQKDALPSKHSTELERLTKIQTTETNLNEVSPLLVVFFLIRPLF